MARRSTQRTRSPQPPDYRTYSAKVTGFKPAISRIIAVLRMFGTFSVPYASSFIIQDAFPNVKHYFSLFYKISEKFLGALTKLCSLLFFPQKPPHSPVSTAAFPPPRGAACLSSPRLFWHWRRAFPLRGPLTRTASLPIIR